MRFYDLDIDVKNYAKRIIDAGYKCPADINSVSDFVKGLKLLNIWNSVEEIWLFRKEQNSGTGSILYALKNNIYNGTLSNTIWINNGLHFNVNNASITMVNYKLKPSPFSIHVIDNTNFGGYDGNGIAIGHSTGGSGSRDRYFYFPGGGREYLGYRSDGGQQFNLGAQITSNNFKSTLFSLKSPTSFEGYFGTTYKSGGTNANFNWDRDGTTNTSFQYSFTVGSNPNPTSSSLVIFNDNINPLYLNYYSLYKSTIGKGLNLP
jgi:hypothetical protein